VDLHATQLVLENDCARTYTVSSNGENIYTSYKNKRRGEVEEEHRCKKHEKP